MKIYVEAGERMADAIALSEKLNTEVLMGAPDSDELCLCYGENGLSLCGMGMSMTGDFTEQIPRLKKARLQGEMLVKAVKLKGREKLKILDATAGMGEDSLLLAAYGHEVSLYEYDPVISALLEDTLKRSAEIQALSECVSRMTLHAENSIEAMKKLKEPPDVVLLDPMFPERSKSGLIKKKFQLLQKLESPCSDEKELMEAAVLAKPLKIVIKRPAKGPYLAGVKPDYSILGTAIRYDCIMFPENLK